MNPRPLAALLALTATASASPPLHGVLGDRIEIGPPQPVILFFMSRRAQDESSNFSRAVDEMLLNAPVESVSIVDVRDYGGLLRGIVMSRLRKAAVAARQRRRERRVARGIDSSPQVVDRWHLIGDFDGSLFDRFGVERDPAHPLALFIDGAGAVHGPYREVAKLISAYQALFPAR